jgi:hypothetical protein
VNCNPGLTQFKLVDEALLLHHHPVNGVREQGQENKSQLFATTIQRTRCPINLVPPSHGGAVIFTTATNQPAIFQVHTKDSCTDFCELTLNDQAQILLAKTYAR